MREYNQFGQELGAALPDWQPRPWPARQILQGSRCRLEPLTLAHASDLFAAHQLAPDVRSWTWLLREPESNLAEFSVNAHRRHPRRGRGGTCAFFTVAEPNGYGHRSALAVDAVCV